MNTMSLEQWFASITNKVNANKSCISLNGFKFDFKENKPYYVQNSVALYLPTTTEDWANFHTIFLVTPGADIAKAIDSGTNCFKAAHKQNYDPAKCYIVLKQWSEKTCATPPKEPTTTKLRKVAIVGTAGRDDNSLLTKATWKAMYNHAVSMVSPDIHLVSGGAAWADHIAVKLFLEGKVGGLTLHLPAKFNVAVAKFEGAYKTAGHTAGYYHSKFTKTVGFNSLKELVEAIKKGAIVTTQEGNTPQNFFNRNTLIAQEAESLLAFTFDDEPKGGTGDTYKKFKLYHKDARAVNININHLVGTKTVTNTTVVPNTSTSSKSTTVDAKEISFEQILDIVSKDSEVISLMYSYLDKFKRIAPDRVENISVQIYNNYIWLCNDKGSNSESCFKSYVESVEARTESAETCFNNEKQDKAAYLASMQIEDTIIDKIIKVSGWNVTPAKYEHPFKTTTKAKPATTTNPSELEELKAQLATSQKTAAKWQSKWQAEKTRADKLEAEVKSLNAQVEDANRAKETSFNEEAIEVEVKVDEVEQTVNKIINNPSALSKLAKAIKALDNPKPAKVEVVEEEFELSKLDKALAIYEDTVVKITIEPAVERMYSLSIEPKSSNKLTFNDDSLDTEAFAKCFGFTTNSEQEITQWMYKVVTAAKPIIKQFNNSLQDEGCIAFYLANNVNTVILELAHQLGFGNKPSKGTLLWCFDNMPGLFQTFEGVVYNDDYVNHNPMFDLSTVNHTVTEVKATILKTDVKKQSPHKVIKNCKLVTIYHGDNIIKQTLNNKDLPLDAVDSGDGYEIYEHENGNDIFFVVQEQFYNDVQPLIDEQIMFGNEEGFTVTTFIYNKQDYTDIMTDKELKQLQQPNPKFKGIERR